MVALKTGHLRAVQTLQNHQSGELSSGDWTQLQLQLQLQLQRHLQLQLQRLQHFTIKMFKWKFNVQWLEVQ